MNNKLIDDLFIASTAGALSTYYSSAVPIGGDNGVMIELWVNTLGGSLDTPGINLHAEGSNDGVNFDSTAVVSTGPVTTGPSWTVGPASGVTPWAWLRLRIEITGDPDASALVSALLRTYRAG